MALIQYGSTITDARGSIAGVTYSRNKGGAYTRARVAPINRNTPRQAAVRTSFGTLSKMWTSGLAPTDRTAWTAFAQANPVVNKLGASTILSGLAMFMSLNQVLNNIGGTPITDPPPDLTVDTIAAVTGATAVGLTGVIELATAMQAVDADASYYIYATSGLSAGKTPGTSDYRFIGAYAPVAAAVVVDFSAKYGEVFGPFVTGNSIGVSVATVNTLSGALTPALIYQILAS